MKPTQAGIWMDHSHAYLIEFTAKPTKPRLIESPRSHGEQPIFRGEMHMHEKEQRESASYYKHLKEAMKAYQNVLLFGPGDSKKELFNIISKDRSLQGLIIKTRQTDKLTPRQMQAFVRKHFMKKQLLEI